MSLGLGQVLIILVIVFVIFGAGKLPKVMGDLGKGLKSFKKGMNDEEGPSK
ncbi:MAG: twin-arginine translocase TatA/TatE family subunit [Alphaproteobacteria bacterium]